MMLNRSTMYYRSRKDPQHALRGRPRELAASRVRFGYLAEVQASRPNENGRWISSRHGCPTAAGFASCGGGSVTRECLLFPYRQLADRPKSRNGIVTSNRGRRAPASIMVETARSFAVAQWKPGPISISVQLDFIRPGCPAENGYIESFNGRLPMSA